MQLTSKETESAIQRWAICNIVDLSKNFFGSPTEDLIGVTAEGNLGVLNKVSSLYLQQNDIEEIRESVRLNDIGLDNVRFKLSFGLNNTAPEFIRVMPILRVFDQNKAVCDFPFVQAISGLGDDRPGYMVGSHAEGAGAYQVPQSYLELVSSTWRDSKIIRIEDVMTAQLVGALDKKPVLSKLLGYIISKNTNSNIHSMLLKYLFDQDPDFDLVFIGFHFGIDLNKMDRSNLFAYVTVIELRLKKKSSISAKSAADILVKPSNHDLIFDSTTEVNILSTQIGPEFNEEEETVQVLYQYLRPCPPACDDPE